MSPAIDNAFVYAGISDTFNDSGPDIGWLEHSLVVIADEEIESPATISSISGNPITPGLYGSVIQVTKKDITKKVSIVILDINSRLQKKIDDATPGDIITQYEFNGLDRRGQHLGRGIYLIIPFVNDRLIREELRKLYVLYWVERILIYSFTQLTKSYFNF